MPRLAISLFGPFHVTLDGAPVTEFKTNKVQVLLAYLAVEADRIHARDIAIFHGAADPKKMNLIERWMIKNVKAPLGDLRDWNVITAWASAISDALLREKP